MSVSAKTKVLVTNQQSLQRGPFTRSGRVFVKVHRCLIDATLLDKVNVDSATHVCSRTARTICRVSLSVSILSDGPDGNNWWQRSLDVRLTIPASIDLLVYVVDDC